MRIFLLLSMCCFFLDLAAQEGRLADFSVDQLNRSNVQIKWTMKAGVSCQSPEVQRSIDSLNFISIYRYPGVCGGGDEEESYSYIDHKAIQNAKSYYRLKIDEGEFSRIAAIEGSFDFSKNAVRLHPQPVTDLLNIAYLEDIGRPIELRIYNANGNEFRVDILSSLNDQPIEVSTQNLPTGIYFVWLEFSNSEARKLKFIKAD